MSCCGLDVQAEFTRVEISAHSTQISELMSKQSLPVSSISAHSTQVSELMSKQSLPASSISAHSTQVSELMSKQSLPQGTLRAMRSVSETADTAGTEAPKMSQQSLHASSISGHSMQVSELMSKQSLPQGTLRAMRSVPETADTAATEAPNMSQQSLPASGNSLRIKITESPRRRLLLRL